MSASWIRIGLLAIVPSVFGCASSAGRSGEAPQAETVVEVTNRNWSTIHAYVLSGGRRLSLGLVTTFRTETFTLPPGSFSGSPRLRFLAVLIGSSRNYLSEDVLVEPGDFVEWVIEHDVAHSHVSVF
jgi:hypothetical protein